MGKRVPSVILVPCEVHKSLCKALTPFYPCTHKEASSLVKILLRRTVQGPCKHDCYRSGSNAETLVFYGVPVFAEPANKRAVPVCCRVFVFRRDPAPKFILHNPRMQRVRKNDCSCGFFAGNMFFRGPLLSKGNPHFDKVLVFTGTLRKNLHPAQPHFRWNLD